MFERFTLRLSEEGLECPKCKMERSKRIHLLIKDKARPTREVRVTKLECFFNESESKVKIDAILEWKCPSCGLPLKGIKNVANLPLEVIRQAWKNCPTCGSEMRLGRHKIRIVESRGDKDVITLTGELVCDNCSRATPLKRQMSLKLHEIWKYIKQLKKIKIGKDGLEIER